MKTQKNILIFQHSVGTPAGSTLNFLKEKNLSYKIHFWGKDIELPRYDTFSGLIILGGPQNVDEETTYPWLRDEKKWIQKFVDLERPTLGLCLGGQLLAEILGGDVKKSPHWEVGWHDVEIDSRASTVIPNAPNSLPVFQWHGYRFETPPHAVRFATNEITPHQGFIYNDYVVGTQFHPESTVDWINSLCHEKKYPQGIYVQSPEKIKSQQDKLLALEKWYFNLLENLFH